MCQSEWWHIESTYKLGPSEINHSLKLYWCNTTADAWEKKKMQPQGGMTPNQRFGGLKRFLSLSVGPGHVPRTLGISNADFVKKSIQNLPQLCGEVSGHLVCVVGEGQPAPAILHIILLGTAGFCRTGNGRSPGCSSISFLTCNFFIKVCPSQQNCSRSPSTHLPFWAP